MLHTFLSSGAGAVGQIVADVSMDSLERYAEIGQEVSQSRC
jgi:hypothetical protein